MIAALLSALIVLFARLVLFVTDGVLYSLATVCACAVWLIQRFGTEDQILAIMRRYLPTAVGAQAPRPPVPVTRVVRLRAPELTELGRGGRTPDDDDLPN